MGHVTPKQARPMSIDKLRCMRKYLSEELSCEDISLKKRFVYLRDRAFLLVPFFTGDPCGDLSGILMQEMRKLRGEEGLVIRQTLGKTLREGCAQTLFIMRNADDVICPVRAVESYMTGVRDMGIQLDTGYVFRQFTNQGYILETPVAYQEMYNHFKTYLNKLHLWGGGRGKPHTVYGAGRRSRCS